MAFPPGLSIEYYHPNGLAIENSDVDAWELKASRRALRNLKTLLFGQPMLDLLRTQIDEGDAYFKEIIARSNGQYKESRFDIMAKGVRSTQFIDWWKGWMGELSIPERRQDMYTSMMEPAHPEHYTLPPYPLGIV